LLVKCEYQNSQLVAYVDSTSCFGPTHISAAIPGLVTATLFFVLTTCFKVAIIPTGVSAQSHTGRHDYLAFSFTHVHRTVLVVLLLWIPTVELTLSNFIARVEMDVRSD
jgi:hypothetical protein